MTSKLVVTALTTLVLGFATQYAAAAEVCKVSMMGRVCFEEGSPEATAAHMKGDAVADAKKAESEKEAKKIASK
jgi:hypothetical protein